MIMSKTPTIDYEKRQALLKEIPILQKEIQHLFSQLDQSYHLHGAEVPVTFGFETDLLGSYTRPSGHEEEHFHFSLCFLGYSIEKPLSKEDRMDLYKHEYAHYMQYNMHIPAEYTWQPGHHGSAWKYCCSLIGAAPTPFYKAGEALLDHDYDKQMKQKTIFHQESKLRDHIKRERDYRAAEGRNVQYQVGEEIQHPKFGTGTIEAIEKLDRSVRLTIRFGDEIKKIDQKWLVKTTKYKRFSDR
jgi:hypothetical protein